MPVPPLGSRVSDARSEEARPGYAKRQWPDTAPPCVARLPLLRWTRLCGSLGRDVAQVGLLRGSSRLRSRRVRLRLHDVCLLTGWRLRCTMVSCRCPRSPRTPSRSAPLRQGWQCSKTTFSRRTTRRATADQSFRRPPGRLAKHTEGTRLEARQTRPRSDFRLSCRSF